MPAEPSQVGLGVENVSDTPYVLVKEGRSGVDEVTTYNTREEALDGLNEVRKRLRKTHTRFSECGAQIQHCEDAIIDQRYNLYTVQTVEDAVRPNGKIIWSVNQSVFFDCPLSKHYEWRAFFATREEAEKLFKERLELYQIQADRDPEIEIVMTDEGRAADIKKNGKLVIDLYCESNEVGGAKRMGTVMLNSI